MYYLNVWGLIFFWIEIMYVVFFLWWVINNGYSWEKNLIIIIIDILFIFCCWLVFLDMFKLWSIILYLCIFCVSISNSFIILFSLFVKCWYLENLLLFVFFFMIFVIFCFSFLLLLILFLILFICDFKFIIFCFMFFMRLVYIIEKRKYC